MASAPQNCHAPPTKDRQAVVVRLGPEEVGCVVKLARCLALTRRDPLFEATVADAKEDWHVAVVYADGKDLMTEDIRNGRAEFDLRALASDAGVPEG